MTPTRLTARLYYATVFCTGAAVLVFEVAAVRLFAPYFGSSLYVLSSVLTVVLAALSLGYFFGGRIADRYPTPVPLYFIIMSAGAVMLLLLNFAQYTLPIAPSVLSLISGPLVMALGLFFVPALLLGMDSPYIIKLLSIDVSAEHNGAVVGSAFFWSTVGSIVGSLAAGFYFIPTIGLTHTIGLISFGLIVLGAVAMLTVNNLADPDERPVTWSNLGLTIVVFLAFGGALYYQALQTTVTNPQITTLYQTDGFYSNIHVFERTFQDTTYRFLKRDTNNSSAIIPGDTTPVFAYAQLANTYQEMVPDASSYLVLGGGAYTIPRQIYHFDDAIDISVVELEPKLLDLAYEYFELPDDPRITAYQQDARLFLQDTDTKYDVIFSDVMNSGHYIPPHLATVEFLEALRARLAPGGVAYINSISSIDTTQESLMGSLTKTINTVFPNHTIIAVNGPDDYERVQNIVYVVRHPEQLISLPDTRSIYNYFNDTSAQLSTLYIDNASLDLSMQSIFTDNKSNVERLIVRQFASQ